MVAVQPVDAPVPAPTVAQIEAIATAATQVDGVEPLGEQTLLDLRDPHAPAVHHVATDPTGRVVGYAGLSKRGAPTAELVVAPQARRCGVGGALLHQVRNAATRLDPAALRVWAHGDLPAARRLAARAGLTVRRELWRMELDLAGADTVDDPEAPPGAQVRTFVVGQDEAAVLGVNARAFAWHPEQGRMSEEDLRARIGEPWFDPSDLLLLEQEGSLLGFCWLKVEPGADTGELYVLAVDPTAQGRGVGRYLTRVAVARLAARPLPRALLYTEADNTAAVRLYAAHGFARTRVDVQYG